MGSPTPSNALTVRLNRSVKEANKARRQSPTRYRSAKPEDAVLPAEVQQLKQKILETHPSKLLRFSMSHMRKWATPPVNIPKNYDAPRSISTVVSGKNVPFTKRMWENKKKKVRHLDTLHESFMYHQ